MIRFYFQLILERRKSRSFSIRDDDVPIVPHNWLAGKRESRSYSITDSEMPLGGGLLGPRKSISEMDARDFENRRKSIYQRRATLRQSIVSFSGVPCNTATRGKSVFLTQISLYSKIVASKW